MVLGLQEKEIKRDGLVINSFLNELITPYHVCANSCNKKNDTESNSDRNTDFG